MRPELRQPAEITNRIEQLVNIKRLKKFSPKRSIKQKHIRELVEQFESVYCYAIMKSIMMSETESENP